jgi:hypothetical protein
MDMAPTFNESRWHQLTEEITVRMRDWRAQHPKATLRKIEDELDRRWAQTRARMLEDLALQSTATDCEADAAAEPPTCPDCGTPLQLSQRRAHAVLFPVVRARKRPNLVAAHPCACRTSSPATV